MFRDIELCSCNLWFQNIFFPSLAVRTQKNVLIAASFIHLKHKEHAKYTSELTTVNPRILLSGPAGLCSFFFFFQMKFNLQDMF
jgi:hypothetical protein